MIMYGLLIFLKSSEFFVCLIGINFIHPSLRWLFHFLYPIGTYFYFIFQ